MQLHAVDTEGAPSNPRSSVKPGRLLDLSGAQDLKQRRVHDQGLRLAHEFRNHHTPQRFQEAPKPAHPPVEGGRVKTHNPGEQVREEPLGIPEERALALNAAQLLEERQGQDLGVREPLYGLLALGLRVERGVGVVGEAEKHGHGVFRSGEPFGMVKAGHLSLLVVGSRMALVVPSIHATDI
jgi:hypothetical protein